MEIIGGNLVLGVFFSGVSVLILYGEEVEWSEFVKGREVFFNVRVVFFFGIWNV